MADDRTHICEIETGGSVITRNSEGDIVSEFTGDWSILHKIYRFAIMNSFEKQKHKRISPNLYIGNISYVFVNHGTKQRIDVTSTQIRKLLNFIVAKGEVQFGGLDTCVGADDDRY